MTPVGIGHHVHDRRPFLVLELADVRVATSRSDPQPSNTSWAACSSRCPATTR